MAKSKVRPKAKAKQQQREKLTADESLKRVSNFARRKESFIATVRKSKGRSLSA